jgi:hypothetical protein
VHSLLLTSVLRAFTFDLQTCNIFQQGLERLIVDNELTIENNKYWVLPSPLEKPICHKLAFLRLLLCLRSDTEFLSFPCRLS